VPKQISTAAGMGFTLWQGVPKYVKARAGALRAYVGGYGDGRPRRRRSSNSNGRKSRSGALRRQQYGVPGELPGALCSGECLRRSSVGTATMFSQNRPSIPGRQVTPNQAPGSSTTTPCASRRSSNPCASAVRLSGRTAPTFALIDPLATPSARKRSARWISLGRWKKLGR